MSTENRTGRRPATSHGRFNLEQQRKRAKELLKAARAGDPAALARLTRHLPPRPEPPRLADAQWVIARENGFASWARLKYHIEALEFARRHAGAGADHDLRTLHIRCGSDIRQALATAGFSGDFLEFADPFCIGPVPALPQEQHLRSRAAFLADAFGMAEGDALARLRRGYDGLDGAAGYQRIVLWFEHDAYDQLILAFVLKRLGELRITVPVELIAVDGVPGVERFVGIGQLAPDVLCWLWQRRVPIGREQFALGARVWEAVTASDPQALHRLARAGTPTVPLMAPALRRHLRELPDLHSGLGLTERLTLEALRDLGPLPVGRVFGELMRQREPLPYLGDTMFWWMVRQLSGGATPLLEMEADVAGEAWPRRRVGLTAVAERVLRGQVNRLDLAPDVRWVGGVAIPGSGGAWCIDNDASRLVWRAA